MDKVKFLDGTPVPDDYLTSASQLVRDAALAIDMFGEDELEAAGCARPAQSASEAPAERKRCCVCGDEIFDDEESGFGACADCLDNVRRGPEAFIEQALREDQYVLRTYAGIRGDVDTKYPTLKAAVAAFQAAPLNSNPRLIYGGKTLLALGAKLMPVFSDPRNGAHPSRDVRRVRPADVRGDRQVPRRCGASDARSRLGGVRRCTGELDSAGPSGWQDRRLSRP